MRTRNFIGLFLMAQGICPVLPAQTPAEMLTYLKKNITIYYLARPNTTNPEYKHILTSGLTLAGKGIIFGETDNSGMDNCAQLLTGLFYERDLDPKNAMIKGKDGDLPLQETIYYALQLSGKPITVFFVNDVRNVIDPGFRAQYSMFLIPGIDMDYSVWTGSFPMKDPAYAGAMVMGEQWNRDLQRFKREFISMVTRLALGSYGAVKRSSFLSFALKKSSPGIYLITTFATHDLREIGNQALAHAYTLYYDSAFAETVFNWMKTGAYFFIPKGGTRSSQPLSIEEEVDVPPEYSLQNKILKYYSKDTGYRRTAFGPDIPVFIFSTWSLYSDTYFVSFDYNNITMYRDLSDYILGITCYVNLRKNGIKKFSACLKSNRVKWVGAGWEEKIKMIVGGLCRFN